MIVNSINLDCNCNVDGSTTLQCKDDGSCDCNKYIDGDKCDQCMEQHYNFPTCSSMQYQNIFGDFKTTSVFQVVIVILKVLSPYNVMKMDNASVSLASLDFNAMNA